MNFAELLFWEILIGALSTVLLLRAALFRGLPSPTYDRVALFIVGLVLLGAVSWTTLLIFLVVTFGTYLGLVCILRWVPEKPRLGLAILVPLQLAPLCYYKYGGFFAKEVLQFSGTHWLQLAIPVGISFYTFQKVAFACDTLLAGKPLPTLLNFLGFAGFFPQIVAGPIERRDDLLPQLETFEFRWLPKDIEVGATWIVLGFFFKRCLADNFALLFNATSTENSWAIWAANLLFGLRIYYDFAGYSFIALGVARCLGVRLTLNFASPYCSTSASDFWRRWHITLSQWLRDYVYIPLGGGRVRQWAFNLLLVFTISGIWHGAGWNFLAWGVMHGVLLIVQRLSKGRIALNKAISWTLTMAAVFLSWLAFYETNSDALRQKFASLVSPSAYGFSKIAELANQWSPPDQFALVCFLLIAVGTHLLEWRGLRRGHEPNSEFRRPWLLALMILLTFLLAPTQQNEFIYFAF